MRMCRELSTDSGLGARVIVPAGGGVRLTTVEKLLPLQFRRAEDAGR